MFNVKKKLTMGFLGDIWNNAKTFLKGSPNAFGSSLIPHLASGVGNMIFGETLEDKQRYALEQMREQAKLNRENFDYQFGRQLEVTDPAFIRQRLERAGLSPTLAFQNGASSPGLSASIGSVTTSGGISSSLHPTSAINVAESVARIRNINADTESKMTDTDYNQKSMQTRLDILSEEKLSKIYSNIIAKIDALYKEKLTSATLDKLKKEMDAITFDMANRKDLTDIERQKLNGYLESLTHQYSLWQSEIDLNVAKTVTEGTQQDLNVAKTDTEGTQQGLNTSLMSYWNSMPQKVKAEADLLVEKANLTEQQSKEVKNLIALRWSRFGVETAEKVSRETREWLYGWIPLRRQGEKMTVDMDKIREETRRIQRENEFWDLNH